jgi:hypothetical protein
MGRPFRFWLAGRFCAPAATTGEKSIQWREHVPLNQTLFGQGG